MTAPLPYDVARWFVEQVGSLFTPQDVEAFLDVAGAPRPWDADAVLVASEWLTVAKASRTMQAEVERALAPAREAKATARKLSRLLSVYPGSARLTAPAVAFTDCTPEWPRDWLACWSEIMLRQYRAITGSGSASASKRGPALRFVKLALSSAGWEGTGGRPLTEAGVEDALRRARRPNSRN